jgi:hypothetical protein
MGESGLQVGICTSRRSDRADGDDPEGRNPLGWALRSLAAQDLAVDRVLVAKHGEATPAFCRLLDRFAGRLPIAVETFSRAEPLGILRNRLVELAGDGLLYFLDDDAILCEPTTLSRQVAAFTAAGEGVAALQAPVLRRSPRPRRMAAGQEADVARVRWDRSEVSFGFDTVLAVDGQALPDPVPPLPIDHLCLAQCLVDPVAVRAVGGFTTFPWPAVYGQESELAVRLARAGRRVRYLPDPQAAVVHLKFGAPHWTGTRLEERRLAGGVSFATAARLAAADEGGDGSWSRKSSAGFFADFVSGFGAVFAHGGQETLERFLDNVAGRFVAGNAVHHPFVVPIDQPEERAAAFLEGVRRLQAGGLLGQDRDWRAVAAGEAVAGAVGELWI